MSEFPNQIDEFRTFTNLPGMEYDVARSDIIFAEDLNKIVNSNIAIQEALGINFLNIWPIGSIYTTVGGSPTTPPFTFGTWVITAIGRMEVGQNVNDVDFDTIEETGGVKTVTLTAAQSGVPAHGHNISYSVNSSTVGGGYITAGNSYTQSLTTTGANAVQNAAQAHTNLPPFYVVRKWKRTA